MRHLYSFTDFLNEGKVEDLHAKYYSGMEASAFHQIVTADPTSITMNGETKKMGTYSKWLLKLFQDGKLLLEDLYKATEYLTLFNKLKAQKVVTGAEADINRYGSLPDLFKHIKTIGGTGEASEDESYLLNDRYYINQGEAEVFHEDDDYLIVIPRSLKASQFYAHGTEWCTRFPDMFKEYSGQGDLYIIIDKHKLNTDNDNRRIQLHFQSEQYMDMLDDRISRNTMNNFIHIFQQAKDGWKLRYDEIGEPCEGRVRVRLNGKFGFIDLNRHEVVPLKYDWVGDYREGRVIIELNGKWGVINLDGNEVVSLKYDRIWDYSDGRAIVRLKDDYGLIDLAGSEVMLPKYDDIGSFNEGRAGVDSNGKYGFINLNGEEVIPLRYDWVGSYIKGVATVELDGRGGTIDLDGNETWR
jgi:hypothetical protein